jgi:hypothetical protein
VRLDNAATKLMWTSIGIAAAALVVAVIFGFAA